MIANIERAANLFLVKNIYALVLAVATVVSVSAYPLEPIQLTLISTLTIGVPGFFLALGPNRRRYVPGFLRRVLRFSVPAGLITGASAYAGYAACRWLEPGTGVAGGPHHRDVRRPHRRAVDAGHPGPSAAPLEARRSIATMAGSAVAVTAIGAIGEGIVLLAGHPAGPAAGRGARGGRGRCWWRSPRGSFSALPAPPRRRSAPAR